MIIIFINKVWKVVYSASRFFQKQSFARLSASDDLSVPYQSKDGNQVTYEVRL